MTLKRLILLVLAISLVAAPVAESFTSAGPVAGAAKKKKGKKCKGKKKGKKSAESAKKKGKKCKKKGGGAPGAGGLPGKPVSPTPVDPTDPGDPSGPALIDDLTLNENPLLAGSSGEGTVTLEAPAPAGGEPVTLGSDDPTRALVPDSVHVAAGQTSADFDIDTTTGAPVSVILTAATPDSTDNVQLDIVDEADLDSLALDYQCFPSPGLTDFGNSFVRLNVRAPDPTIVDLESSDPFALAVPPSVTVPDGSFTGFFTVDTLATTNDVTVTGTYDGVQRSDSARILDGSNPPSSPTSMTTQPASVVKGNPSTGTVTLDCEAPPGGTTVTLSTSYPGVTVPASVVVPQGELSATFQITTSLSAAAGDAVIEGNGGAVQATLNVREIGT